MSVKLVIDLEEEAEDGTVETMGEALTIMPGDKVHRASVAARSQKDDMVPDLTELSPLNEASILSAIRKRYSQAHSLYTYIGPTLVAINSFCDQDGAYGADVIQSYINAGAERGDTEPHIFSVGKEVYNRLVSTQKNQAVIITGESGAGKSFSAKKVLEFFAEVSASKTGQESEVAQNILIANPILEAFGNAKMPRNDDSSRFGKLFKIVVDMRGAIVGCKIETYLLEKSRVTRHGRNERNFHIFYMLLAYLEEFSPDWMDSLGLDGAIDLAEYRFLSKATEHGSKEERLQDDNEIKMEEDADKFQYLIDALEMVGFSDEEQLDLWKSLVLVMKLGNITFEDNGEGKAQVADMDAVEKCAAALGIEGQVMADALCSREFANPSKGKEGQFISFKVAPDMASQNRDAIAKTIYSGMFDEVVRRVNEVFRKDMSQEEFDKYPIVSVLDIFGFETIDINSLEQLLINYANEQLHDYFSRHMYAEQIELLQRETTLGDAGVSYFYEHVNEISTEQKNRVALLRDTLLGSALDEVCAHPRGTDPEFMSKMKEEVESNEFVTLKLGKDEEGEEVATSFTIKHFAEVVEYKPEGFVDKNKFKLYSNLVKMVQGGNNQFVIKRVDEDFALGSKNMYQRFQESLTSLIDLLDNSAPRFIRCLKSNMKKREWEFEPEIIHRQLIYASLLQTVKICTMGFPEQHAFMDFYLNYRTLFMFENEAMRKWEEKTKCCSNPDGLSDGEWRQGLEFVMKGCETKFGKRIADLIKMGDSEVLLREEASQALDGAKAVQQKDACDLVVEMMENVSVRKEYIKAQAIVDLQSVFRASVSRPPFYKHCMAIDLQSCLRTIIHRKEIPKDNSAEEEAAALAEAEEAEQEARDLEAAALVLEDDEDADEDEKAEARKEADEAASVAKTAGEGLSLKKTKGAKKLQVPEEYKSIKAAIKAANEGDMVEVGPGVYEESIVIDKPIILKGTQRMGCLISVTAQTAIQLQLESPDMEATLVNITVQIKAAENNHNAVSVHCGHMKIMGCGFFGGFCGMLVHRGSSAELRNSIVRNCSAGVVVDSGSRFNMIGCRVHGNKRCGIAILGEGSVGDLSKNEIHGNEGFAVGVWRKAELQMSNNKVHGNEKGGVYVHGQGTSAVITNNKFGPDGSWQVAGKAKLEESENEVAPPVEKKKKEEDTEMVASENTNVAKAARDTVGGQANKEDATAAGRKILRIYLADGSHNAIPVNPEMTARDVCRLVADKKKWLKNDEHKDGMLLDGLAIYDTSSVPVNYRRRLVDDEKPCEVMDQWQAGRSHKFILNTKKSGKEKKSKGAEVVVRIYIVDGTHVSLSTPAGSSVKETCEMLSRKRSAEKALEGEEVALTPLWDTFTLYEVNYAQDGSSSSWRSLGDEEILTDVMATAPKGVSSLFLFKKRIFLPREEIVDNGYLHITYLQVITALRSRLYGSPAKPFKQTLCDADLVQMAALHMYYMLGPSDGENSTLSLLWRTMQACVPNGVWKAYSPGATRACEQYAELALESQQDAAKQLMAIAQKYPHFGREFFPVRGHNPPIAIGVGYEGILVVHAVTRAPITNHSFGEIESWKASTDEMITTALEYTPVGGEKSSYTTPDAYEIVLLLDKYKARQ